MSTHDVEFSALMHRVREGSEEAFQELVDKYSHHVYRVVRSKLDAAVRSKFDSVDFVQSVWACFFENRERLLNFGAARDLINFLAKLASDRVTDEHRRRLVLQGKNVNREVPLPPKGLVSACPTPSQFAIANERLQKLLAEHSDESRRMIEMRLEGASHAEIALALGVSQKSIQRALRVLERSILS